MLTGHVLVNEGDRSEKCVVRQRLCVGTSQRARTQASTVLPTTAMAGAILLYDGSAVVSTPIGHYDVTMLQRLPSHQATGIFQLCYNPMGQLEMWFVVDPNVIMQHTTTSVLPSALLRHFWSCWRWRCTQPLCVPVFPGRHQEELAGGLGERFWFSGIGWCPFLSSPFSFYLDGGWLWVATL